MPNLFFHRKIDQVFDLKGSTRNRYVDIKNRKDIKNTVLLDQNFMEYTKGFPLPLSESSKEMLNACVHNDSMFLTSLSVVDYSLLVGLDNEKNELVVGIIDYIRQYTWDKQLETGKMIVL